MENHRECIVKVDGAAIGKAKLLQGLAHAIQFETCLWWKYLKYELQVPIYVAEEGRGWQTIIINYEKHIFHRRGIGGIQNTSFNTFTFREKTNTVTQLVSDYQTISFIKHFYGKSKYWINIYIFHYPNRKIFIFCLGIIFYECFPLPWPLRMHRVILAILCNSTICIVGYSYKWFANKKK